MTKENPEISSPIYGVMPPAHPPDTAKLYYFCSCTWIVEMLK